MTTLLAPQHLRIDPVSPVAPRGRSVSHRVEQSLDGEHVVIRDLELFIGFDDSIDSADDKRIKKYDATGIDTVVKQTRKFMTRGQNPKLILGHNSDGIESYPRPVIGDIVSISGRSINGAPGIIGDVEMTSADFASYLKTNQYPRRSAEIWPEGFMSEVALLGSETPARPLPDTHFSRMIDRFSRKFDTAKFAEPTTMPAGAGPGNVTIPDERRNAMADDDKKDDDTLKARLKAALDEIEELKAKLKSKHSEPDDGDEEDEKEKGKSKNAREQFTRQIHAQGEQIATLKRDLVKEQFGRQLDALTANGYQTGDSARQEQILERIAVAKDPAAEFDFFMRGMHRLPTELQINTRGVTTGTFDAKGEAELFRRARENCSAKGMHTADQFAAEVARLQGERKAG